MGEILLNGRRYGTGTVYKEVTQSEYNALPSSKFTDNILYCIKDAPGAGGGFPPLIYSCEEREVGVWLDGKPLYQKAIEVQSNGASEGREYYDISDLNVDLIVSLYGYANDGLFNRFIPYMYRSESSDTVSESVCIFYRLSTTSLEIVHRGKDYGIGHLVIQYTKTTDVAGSGKWTVDGTQTLHYSTTEKVIGTWIDGKPLYERVMSVTLSNSDAHHDFSSDTLDHPEKASVIEVLSDRIGVSGNFSARNASCQTNFYVVTDTTNENYGKFAGFTSRSDFANKTFYGVIHYTKTTD